MTMKIVVGVTGASGAIYAKALINKINAHPELVQRCDVIFSDQARKVWEHELNNSGFDHFPNKLWPNNTFFAPFASGSSDFDVLIVCPCTMGTMAKIASGLANDLISRAADVMLKEHRKLILVTRETPLNLLHINNMKAITEAGGIILPANPSYYNRPTSIDELIDSLINKILSVAGLNKFRNNWMV
ncbi:MAG: 3-octaprenyl-4-hydroxybenzoate carboxy-lyase [Bacteroidetes bacterium 4484_276]|nr:MAG: 3-octaprenyl-4-hydroxybenzoate carboxy-lyase [Bacteroidetes bacterium 4484_276]